MRVHSDRNIATTIMAAPIASALKNNAENNWAIMNLPEVRTSTVRDSVGCHVHDMFQLCQACF